VFAEEARAPRVLGIDDWAWRKGRLYGTILCDLERGKIIDLLPGRSVESTAPWLCAHPGAEIISRDRASLYAEAASKAAPQAIQVAGRWHLMPNLSEAFVDALAGTPHSGLHGTATYSARLDPNAPPAARKPRSSTGSSSSNDPCTDAPTSICSACASCKPPEIRPPIYRRNPRSAFTKYDQEPLLRRT